MSMCDFVGSIKKPYCRRPANSTNEFVRRDRECPVERVCLRVPGRRHAAGDGKTACFIQRRL